VCFVFGSSRFLQKTEPKAESLWDVPFELPAEFGRSQVCDLVESAIGNVRMRCQKEGGLLVANLNLKEINCALLML